MRPELLCLLMLLAQVDSAGDGRLRPFIRKALGLRSSADSAVSAQPSVRLDRAKDVRLAFDAQLAPEDVRLFGAWLAKQPEVLTALQGMPRKQLVTLMEKACQEQPMAGHMFLDNQVGTSVEEAIPHTGGEQLRRSRCRQFQHCCHRRRPSRGAASCSCEQDSKQQLCSNRIARQGHAGSAHAFGVFRVHAGSCQKRVQP